MDAGPAVLSLIVMREVVRASSQQQGRSSALQPGPVCHGTLCVSSAILPQAINVLVVPPPFFSSNLNQEASGNYTKGAGGSLS